MYEERCLGCESGCILFVRSEKMTHHLSQIEDRRPMLKTITENIKIQSMAAFTRVTVSKLCFVYLRVFFKISNCTFIYVLLITSIVLHYISRLLSKNNNALKLGMVSLQVKVSIIFTSV